MPSPHLLAAFIANSRLRNQKHRLHELMVLMGLDFLLVLEGEPEAVNDVCEQWAQRYRPVTVVRQEIGRPLFGDWSLGLLMPPLPGHRPDPETAAVWQQVMALQPRTPAEHDTLEVIRQFLQGKWHLGRWQEDAPVILQRLRM